MAKVIEKMYKDSSGEYDNARFWFSATMCVALIKVLLSGVSYGGFSMQEVDLAGLAAFIGAVGAVYWGRNRDKKEVK